MNSTMSAITMIVLVISISFILGVPLMLLVSVAQALSAKRTMTRESDNLRSRKPLISPGRNRIIRSDNNGHYIVEANQADDIAGGPDMTLPATVQRIQKGLYVVSFTGYLQTHTYKQLDWKPASGQIVPRTPSIVRESFLEAVLGIGVDHHYVQR